MIHYVYCMFANKELKMITDVTALEEMCEHLTGQAYIGVDLEGDSLHHYHEKVCLIQVSDLKFDYIIDPIRIKDISSFLALMADDTVQKVMHGADYDVVSLKRDYDAPINNLFDTMIAAQFLAYPKIGLAHLIHRHFGLVIDKAYQTHDWSRRPLYDEHLAYARGDTHFLLALRELLQWKLDEKDISDACIEECFWQTQREWNGRKNPEVDFLRVKHSHKLSDRSLRILRQLYLLREGLGKASDRPVFRVFSEDILMRLTKVAPQNSEELAAMFKGKLRLSNSYGPQILSAIQKGLEDETTLPRHKVAPRPKNGPNFEKVMGDLRLWRNDKIEQLSLQPVVVFSNGQLRNIAREMPIDLVALSDVEAVRNWQVKWYGSEIVNIVKRYHRSTK